MLPAICLFQLQLGKRKKKKKKRASTSKRKKKNHDNYSLRANKLQSVDVARPDVVVASKAVRANCGVINPRVRFATHHHLESWRFRVGQIAEVSGARIIDPALQQNRNLKADGENRSQNLPEALKKHARARKVNKQIKYNPNN